MAASECVRRLPILAAEILILATPTWVGQPSSVAKRVIERMDAMLSETDDNERPVASNRVAGFVVTGNEDGAHHVIAELSQAVGDVGFTVPGQAFTYWNMGPGPGSDYSDTDHGHDYSVSIGRPAVSKAVGGSAKRSSTVPSGLAWWWCSRRSVAGRTPTAHAAACCRRMVAAA